MLSGKRVHYVYRDGDRFADFFFLIFLKYPMKMK